MKTLLTTLLLSAMMFLVRTASAEIDACVSTANELSVQFSIAQATNQDLTLKVVRGSYDIAGTALVSEFSQIVRSVSLLGGYSAGCTTRTVDPVNTQFTSSALTGINWRTTGRRLAFEGITFSGNGTQLVLLNSIDNDDPVTMTLRRNIFRSFAPPGGTRTRVDVYTRAATSGSRVLVENNLFHGNFADSVLSVTGYGSSFDTLAPLDISIVNNTVAANLAETGVCVETASVALLANNIVRDHAFDIDTQCSGVAGIALVRSINNNFETRRTTVPLIEIASTPTDPQFVAATTDFHLQNGSPAINSGSTSSEVGLSASDIESNVRFQGLAPDRGAYESANTGLFIQTVSNTNNSGAGSLRQAIIGANGTPGLNLILFDIAGACPRTINLTSALPTISESVRIDAMTQPGSAANTSSDADNATRCIIVKPVAMNTISRGLTTSSTIGSGIQLGINGIAMGGFSEAAIYMSGGGAHYVQGSQFGGSVGGVTLPANATSILVGASEGARIGGPDDSQRNLIGAASVAGVSFELASNSSILNNLIGLTANGRFAEANAIGVRLNAANDNRISDNVISGNGNGIVVLEPNGFNSRRNVIGGNRIGLRAVPIIGSGGSTDYRLGNDFNGVLIYGNDNVIGECRYIDSGQAIIGAAANTIAYNGMSTGAAGINVRSGRGVCIAGNRVYANNATSGQQIDIGTTGIDAIDNDSAASSDALSNRGINAPSILNIGGSDTRGSARVRLQSRNGIYRVLIYSRAEGCIAGTTQGEARDEQSDPFNVSISNATATTDGFVEFDLPVATIGSQASLIGRGFIAQVQRSPNPISEPPDSSELGGCRIYTFDDVIFANGFES